MISQHFCFSVTGLIAVLCGDLQAAPSLVFFGTYAGENSKGIYVSKFDGGTGKLSPPELAAEIRSPSFLALHPTAPILVAVNESGTPESPGGAVTSFTVDPASGRLTQIDQRPSGGAGPCHVAIDPSGRVVVAANYGGGSIVSLPLHPDGKLGEALSFFQHEGRGTHPNRQQGPHAHSATIAPDGRHVVVCDLGLDRIFSYRILPNLGGLEPAEPPFVKLAAGAGPRHFAFHPSAPIAYAINELNSSVTTLKFNSATGALEPSHTVSSLPADANVPNNSTAHIEVHPSGKWVYGSNRGHDSLAQFAVDQTTGWLRFIGTFPSGGKTPRNFGIDPAGKWLLAANQNSDSVVVHQIDARTGSLTPTESSISLGKPVCVKFFGR